MLLCLVISCANISAQTQIQGFVLDADTGKPIEGIRLVADEKRPTNPKVQRVSKHCPTNQIGYFDLSLEERYITLSFSAIGYETLELPIDSLAALTKPVILLEPNSYDLQEINVTAFKDGTRALQVPASVSLIDKAVIDKGSSQHLTHAINTMPGVRMERRAPASYRISIRGSSLRSPFGVRNVKIYMNDLPFTGADGTTFLNLIDPAALSRIEVIKGPASSLYGAGTGGAIHLHSETSDANHNEIALASSMGSYGLLKYRAMAKISSNKGGLCLSYNHQEADGYRRHSNTDRETLQLSTRLFAGANSVISLFALYSDLKYQIPGGLNAEQYEEDPRQARPGNAFAAGSEQQNSSIDQQNLFAGLGWRHYLAPKWVLNTSAYSTITDLENPFITNYKQESSNELGGRAVINFDNSPTSNFGQESVRSVQFSLGAETQLAWTKADNYGNVSGVRDSLNFSDDIFINNNSLFGQAEWTLPLQKRSQELRISAGLSVNKVDYEIDRLNFDDTEQVLERDFSAVISPRIAIAFQASTNQLLYANISHGFSPPTLDEIRTSEGTVNEDLEAEQGFNYELGLKSTVLRKRGYFALSGYLLQLNDAIVSQVSENGTVLFYNAGKTNNAGIESSLLVHLISKKQKSGITDLNWWNSYTYNHHRFDGFVKRIAGENTDLSGNELTGSNPHTYVTGFDLRHGTGLYAHVSCNFSGKIPLNDLNTVYSEAYQLLNAKIGWQKQIDSWKFDLNLGAENLLDQKYSLGHDLNPFGSRYYQPSPTRNFFGGVAFSYLF